MQDLTPPRYTVAVRSLCEFTAKAGDLDLRFTPSPTAQEGIAGHKSVTARRPASYESEVSLSGECDGLQVRGRCDGYDPDKNQLEEIKTYRGDFDAIPDNHRALHWAQAKVYGWLLCQARGLTALRIALVYYDIGSQQETVLAESFDAPVLQAFFALQCGRFLAWSEQERAHRAARDTGLRALRFPHADFRPGQRDLAEAVYRGAVSGRRVLAQAPTGIGKSIGTLFPLLKALPDQAIDKVFFLTAKTSGRSVALDALTRIGSATPDARLRVIELVARDKACEHPDAACHGASCPLARGFYDRLPQARAAALSAASAVVALDRARLREVALAHQVCPYYLGQELVRWADAVVGDYNYYFDPYALLHGLTLANDWRIGLLVDEAHNLPERARAMYSAALDETLLRRVAKNAPQALAPALRRLTRGWQRLRAQSDEAGASETTDTNDRLGTNDTSADYRVLPEVPAAWRNTLQQSLATIAEFLAANPTDQDPDLMRFYFDATHFSRLCETFDTHSLFDLTLRHDPQAGRAAGKRESSTLCIRNSIPAPFLAPRFAAAHSATLFSATLSPQHFYRDMLGLPQQTVWIDVVSPFAAEQLSVQVVQRISTRYADRRHSVAPIVALMARQYAREPGNYLAFFSSFDYLDQVAAQFAASHAQIPTWVQSRGMDEAAREAFVGRFTADGAGIGFAVLGGAFAEGIDLPGSRLIGAFIATLGLPQINPINEQMMQRMEATFAAGYDYTYLYPGIQKVVQAAGRVIRTESDRGVVYLIDDRFMQPRIRRLLPAWWDVHSEQAERPIPPTTQKKSTSLLTATASSLPLLTSSS